MELKVRICPIFYIFVLESLWLGFSVVLVQMGLSMENDEWLWAALSNKPNLLSLGDFKSRVFVPPLYQTLYQ